MTDFKALLRNPPEAARGMTRWWWYGCAVEEKEIDRELNLMKEAGIGGVELQILYPLHRDDREKGVQNVPYFSPRFFELTGYCLLYTSLLSRVKTHDNLGITNNGN